MVKSEKKYVVAWTHAQARHFAQSMDWARSEWTFVDPRYPERMQGLYGVILYEVRAPRYRPTEQEHAHMEEFWLRVRPMIESGRGRLNVVNLP